MTDRPRARGLDGLDPPTWRRIAGILDEALELPGDERPAFLDRACGGDAVLRARIEGLLTADRYAGTFLERPLGPHALAWIEAGEEAAGDPAGRRIGAWRLVREVGRGGGGAVFLAERADGAYAQRAAVKLLQRTLAADDARARFVRERQILARLEHPNVARLLDGGVTDDGAPFLAMEFVDGEPITAWCERTGAGLRGVVRLFRQVCHAVDDAHRHLVIHRDLKPANIFVTAEGEVKLLDFGIAKLLEPDAGPDPGTVTIERRLTPHYAAPEQIRGEASTTATDVYGLGVVLYELLTGVRPFHGRTATPLELERAVLAEDPPAPSTALAGGAAGLRQRSWRAAVRGDLDRIVLQAMRRDPAARYPTAHAMLEDLERWLDGRPVRATPPTAGYRVRKFVARNPVTTAVASGLVLALVGGLIGVSWQARRARDEERRAEVIRDFALGLFRGSDPSEAKGDTLTARELLDRGAARVDQELRGQPALQSEVFRVLGGVYRELELYDRAREMLERSVARARDVPGAAKPGVAPSLVDLGAVLTDQARLDEAERALREALALRPGGRDSVRARALALLAVVEGKRGRFAAADSLFRAALAVEAVAHGPCSLAAAQVLDDLGTLCFDRRDYERAAEYSEQALAIRMELLGRDAVATANAMENVAAAVGPLGRHAREDSLHAAALDVFRRLLGPESMRVGNVLSNLGAVQLARGDTATAESTMREAVRVFRVRLGEGHPETARTIHNLAYLLAAGQRYAEAESLYRRSIVLWGASLGERHPLTLHARTNLAGMWRDAGRFAEAEEMLHRVVALDAPPAGSEGAETALALHHLGLQDMRRERYDAAERELRRALAIRARVGGSSGAQSQSLAVLGEAMLYRGRLAESARLFREAADLDSARGEKDRWRGPTLGLGRVRAAQGAFGEAESLVTDAVVARTQLGGTGHRRTLEARAALALCYAASGRNARAAAILDSVLPVLERMPACPAGLLRQCRAARAPALAER